ncbi:MAG: protein kinase domain-containing protein [Prosthecobacter sp.]
MSTSQSGSKPARGWQPPSLEEMQAMLPQYHFEKLLGRGGMGAVYKAVQASLDRAVAIKVLPGDLVRDGNDDAQFAERFKNEARTMAKMSHPSIVNVFDFGETQSGLLYFVMEFIDGTDVAQMIASQGKLPEAYALSITAHVCDALAYAHARGVIHRDIKPANILINMEGAVKVADFGLAKQNDAGQALTKTNMAMGTPDFVAPEALVSGVPLDGRVDLYAIGVMLYQMLTGDIPRGMWTMPGVRVGTDPRFDAIIAKAMQTDREARYQSAGDLRRDLDTIMTLPRAVIIQRQQEAAEAAAKATRMQQAATTPPPHEKAAGPPATTQPRPKSKTGLIIGLTATAALAAGAFFIFGSGQKAQEVTKTKAEVPAVKVSKPAASSSRPATPPAPKPTPVVAATAPEAFTEPVPVLGVKAVDLLPRIDLSLDKVLGIWDVEKGELTYTSPRGASESRVQIPVRCTGSYTVDVELSTRPSPGDVALFLPFAKGSGDDLENIVFLVAHDNKGNHRAGFAHFNVQPAFARNTPGWVKLDPTLGTKSRITVQVLLKSPDRLALKAWVDGKPLVAWEGLRGETSGGSRVWRPAKQGYFALGTEIKGTTFHRVRLEPMDDAKVEWLRAAPPATLATAPAMPPAAPKPQPPEPADPVSAKLASLEKTFLDAHEKQIGAAHKAAVADLNAKLIAALDRNIATASQAGKLDEALALRNEKAQIQNAGALPESDDEGTPDALKALRKTWREQMAGLIAKRNQSAAPLYVAYDRALAAYQDELTKAQKLDEALRVKAVREHITSQRESSAPPAPASTAVAATTPAKPAGSGGRPPVSAAPVAPPLSADKVLPPPPPATQEEIRALCEWALNKDGRVALMVGGKRTDFVKGEALPKGKLTVVEFFVYELSFEETADESKWFTVIGRLPDLESIYFNKNPGKMSMEMLRGATKLKSLRLAPESVDDAAFAHLTGLKNLESLDITYMVKQFAGTGLGYINENLQFLGTSSPTLTAEGMAYLARFKKLKKLDLTGDSLGGRVGSLTDAMLAGLAALAELEELKVSQRNLDGSFLAFLPANSKLKRLELFDLKAFKPENFKHLAKLKHLEYLALPSVDPGVEGLAYIAGLGALKEMAVAESNFTGEAFKGLKGFRGLGRLWISGCPLNDAGIQAIATAVPDLKSFEFSNNEDYKVTVTAEGFAAALERLRSLTSLQINGRRTTDAWLPAIARQKSVDYLMLTEAQITDQGLTPLMKLPLGYLRLDGTPVTDAVIPILKACPTLRNVPVGSTKMTDAGKAELKKMLESR